MKLFYSPLACSMATRIALHESGTAEDVTCVEIDPETKTTADGTALSTRHPLELVPVPELDDGECLMENAAILQYVADRAPRAGLAPSDPRGRSRLHQWLSFIGTELHKAVYLPLLDRKAPEAVKAYALAKAPARLAFVASRLASHDHLLDDFTVADAYLFTVLNWSRVTPIDLTAYPPLAAYQRRLRARPAVARALAEDEALYRRRHPDRGADQSPSTDSGRRK